MRMLRLFLVVSLLFIYSVANAQLLKNWQGDYGQGKANYTYYENKVGKKIPDGKFHYEEDGDAKLVVEGFYKNGRKQGEWVYDNGKAALRMHYSNGVLNGEYEFVDYIDSMNNIVLHFKDNLIVGEVHHKFEDGITLSGRFDSLGFPEGEWKEKSDGMPRFQSTYTYQKGFLTEILLKDLLEHKSYFLEKCMPEFEKALETYEVTVYGVINDIVIGDTVYFMDKQYNVRGLPTGFGFLVFRHFASFGDKQQDKFEGGLPFRGIPYFVVSKKGKASFFAVMGLPKVTSMTHLEEGVFYSGTEDVMPEFLEGDVHQWVDENLKYPEEALKRGIKGWVLVRFIIECDGSIIYADATIGNPELRQEAIRVVKSMPVWMPGEKDGKKVRIARFLYIPFGVK